MHDVRRVTTRLLPALAMLATPLIGPVVAPAAAQATAPLAPEPFRPTPLFGTPPDEPTRLHLVTLNGPGARNSATAQALRAQQDTLRTRYSLPTPVSRWTTALNGFSVRLTQTQANYLRSDPLVARVQPDTLLAASSSGLPGIGSTPTGRGGRGVVIGVVSSGVSTDTAAVARHELVRSRSFVDGYGAQNVRSTDPLDGGDVTGQGTAIAALAAGNNRVSRELGLQIGSEFSGTAPAARVASYKACWTAPDPSRDGCALSDVVTAIDVATADKVSVLALPLRDRRTSDTLTRATIGAVEEGVVVVTDGSRGAGDQTSPGVATTARQGAMPTGVLRTQRGTFTGTMLQGRGVRTSRVVTGRTIGARYASTAQAAQCVPGSLDAAKARGAIVVCERGGIARTDKSQAVSLADGAAMVLTNTSQDADETWIDDTPIDLHTVPTLHLGRAQSEALKRAMTTGPLDGSLQPLGLSGQGGAGPATPYGLVRGAAGSVIAPAPRLVDTRRWAVLDPSSTAVARVSGVAARIRAQHPRWSAERVTSVLLQGTPATAGRPYDAFGRPQPGQPSANTMRRAWEKAQD